jgi:hypothetical protein
MRYRIGMHAIFYSYKPLAIGETGCIRHRTEHSVFRFIGLNIDTIEVKSVFSCGII